MFDSVVGRTPDMLKEAAIFTGISIRTIQRYYRGDGAMPSAINLMKLLDYFSYKLGREVKLSEILIEQKNVHSATELSLAAFRAKNAKFKIKNQ